MWRERIPVFLRWKTIWRGIGLTVITSCLGTLFPSMAIAAGSEQDASSAEETKAFQVPDHIPYEHGLSLVFDLKYPADFLHFDYVNPDAPRGGTLELSAGGTYDSFNHWAGRGRPAEGLSGETPLLYDQLLVRSADEPSARYGLLAEGVAVANDYQWIAFKIREGARFHDGEPVTVDDVIFTFKLLQDHGSPVTRTNLRAVQETRQIGEREVIFFNDPEGINNRNVVEMLGAMEILPKHYWDDRDPTRTTRVPPVGSGPYRVADHRVGRYVVYERDPNYWANDLPVIRGRFNFKQIKYDYFMDEQLRRQALNNGGYDLLLETVSKSWQLDYEGQAQDEGHLILKRQTITEPAGLWWAVTWNLRHERFQDVRVREALWLLFDFEFTNRVLMHSYYDNATSYFQGSQLAHEGLPSEAELELLEPLRDQVPARVFTEPYAPPPSRGYGYNRENKLQALKLFQEAGWEVRNGRLVHTETGEPFTIEFVVIAPALVRLLIVYMDSLNRIGIDARARAIEQANYFNRMQHRQFESTRQNFIPGSLPGPNLRHQFSSEAAEQSGSLNWAGIQDPVVDYLIERIINADSEEALLTATRAFDRVMLWNFYYIPGLADADVRYVHWNRFGMPEGQALRRPAHIDTWWFDEEKSRQVDEWHGRD